MHDVILRRTRHSTVPPARAAMVVEATPGLQLMHRSGDNMLVKMDLAQLPALQKRLPGWIVSPQGAPVPVPDTRLRVRAGGG